MVFFDELLEKSAPEVLAEFIPYLLYLRIAVSLKLRKMESMEAFDYYLFNM